MTTRERWSNLGALLVAGLVAGLVGGLVGGRASAPAHAAGQNVYRAERFELVAPDGKVAAVLGFDTTQLAASPVLRLWSADGKASVALEVNVWGGNLTLTNSDGKSQLTLRNGALASTGPVQPKSNSWIEIFGRDGSSVWRAP